MLNVEFSNNFLDDVDMHFDNDDKMIDDLAVGNLAKGKRELAYDIQNQMNNGFTFNKAITLYHVTKTSDNDWVDDDVNPKENGLDLSKVNFGKVIKHDVKKVIDLSSQNDTWLSYYNNHVLKLDDTTLYIIDTNKNGFNYYRPLNRNELVSLSFDVGDTDNEINEPQYNYHYGINHGRFVIDDSRVDLPQNLAGYKAKAFE